jgi:D-beta-D-heptose 7-phosphate kinase/D-beta-D-heptose 1-phosphate adenosyltransferase
LHEARANCDRLVVGLNGDDSVRRLKGSGRPLQSAEARAAVMTSLSTVDLIVVFEEDTPIKVIEAIRPDLLIKGADYRHKDVVGGDFVQSYGGKILLAPLLPGHSTTAIVGQRSARQEMIWRDSQSKPSAPAPS